MVLVDAPLPEVLGPLLYQPKPTYIAKHIAEPTVVFEFGFGTGEVVQLDRYHFFADQESNPDASLTQEARSRDSLETLGTGKGRTTSKDTLYVTLKEFTGPADPTNPTEHSSFRIDKKKLLTARRAYWNAVSAGGGEIIGERAFHDSLGSAMLIDDFKRWEDRIYINEWLKTQFYVNPDQIEDGATVDVGVSTSYAGHPPKWKVRDSEYVVKQMLMRNCPTFDGGFIRCLSSLGFIYDMRGDERFMEIARYAANAVIPATEMRMGVNGQPDQIASLYNGVQLAQQQAFSTGLQTGFGGMANGVPMMPRGFIFDGVHYFTSTNVPKLSITMNYSNPLAKYASGSAAREAEIGIFFGPQSIGIGLGGDVAGPQIVYHNDTDWNRFLILCWMMYGVYKLLDDRFVTIGRSFQT